MPNVSAYGVPSVKAALEPMTIGRRAVGPQDVRIEIKYCGVCHTDVFQTQDGWGPGVYPMVPGHEITGFVTEVGAEVTKFAPGDRVGVGTYIDSCRECENCRSGLEVYCTGSGVVPTYNSRDPDGNPNQGGYSTAIVVDEHFVVRVPEGLGLDVAAPLLCAGITTYSPLRHWNAGPGTKVAVLGMGGLGHVAVQFAHALGADVTVLSRTLGKKEDGLRLGADHYYATNDPATFDRLAGQFDLILCTISSAIGFDAYLNLLKVNGTLVNVGAPDEPISLDNWSLIPMRRSYAASSSGGVPQLQEMLDFAAEHGVAAVIEQIRPEEINEAFEKLERAEVRYRFVMDTAQL
ncbi:NAD(P)-dependent alcohol dehydrogenase [Amycolatopsis jiangsuensis]|uniref:alcohol dehydrogenase (NADP(+)) n=1 Tax=Amycolatopsis jiangsuensis TaxID=1181879 RepID=A0A840J769_9PSEU|nr:NAD(P)-dependent alcohol dehydrogenase [Amycolatopsis jiangsuensis]MBB4689633.1 putative zinc-type alcohol dehydrogenase-like protein [Amycolatopsis jiangsuensis]